MTESCTIQLRSANLAEDRLGFFRFGSIGDQTIITNDVGAWHLLSRVDFEDFIAGRITAEHRLYEPLATKGFLCTGQSVNALAEQLRQKKSYLGKGPHLHIAVTTLRCNQSCHYCHATRKGARRADTDMSLETAKKMVDHAMQSPSPYINFEFQGGEPTLNMPVVEFIVNYSKEKNRTERKILEYSLVTNLTAITVDIANWLVDNDVLICTSLDGPAELHNYNRTWKVSSDAYETVRKWIDYINARYVENGRDPEQWHVDALLTTSRKSFEYAREIIDLYVELGLHSIHLRPLNMYGCAADEWQQIGYSSEEFLQFYFEALDYMMGLNLAGTEIVEGTAAIFLAKMLTPNDPRFVDILSPCGAGTGQVAYNYDGRMFTCDEARMAAVMGVDMFQIGEVGTTSLAETLDHPTVRTLALASFLDSLPRCETCWNAPYCGVCPIHNHMTTGDFFCQDAELSKCKIYYAIVSRLFEKLACDQDGKTEAIFKRWTLTRPRDPLTRSDRVT